MVYYWLPWLDTNIVMHAARLISWTGCRVAFRYTVYPTKYAHGFVVLCFVVVMQSFIMNSHEVFIHIHQGCFAGTGAIVRLPQCQWSKPDGYGKISQCITTTKHSKAKTVCIWWSLHWWLQNEWKNGGSGGHQPPFPEWWDNLPPTVQKTARQQHHLCSWGYSHQSGTELLPTHGPSPSWRGSLLWLNVLFADNWGWRHREPFYLRYHEPALVIEWQRHTCPFLQGTKPLWHWRKWKSGPTSKRDPRPRYRPTGKCPLYRYETTGQLLHSEVGSNQVGYSCAWQRSLSCEPTLGPPKKFQHLTRAEEVVITRLRIGHTKATKSHILSRGPPTGCHHCGQTLTIDHMLLECALLQESRDEYYTVHSLNALFETIPETCIVEFLREAGFFYLI